MWRFTKQEFLFSWQAQKNSRSLGQKRLRQIVSEFLYLCQHFLWDLNNLNKSYRPNCPCESHEGVSGEWTVLVQHSTVQYSTVQYSTVQYSAVQYSTVQYSTVQCSAVQCSAVQYSTVRYSAVQVSTFLDLAVSVPLHALAALPPGNKAPSPTQ